MESIHCSLPFPDNEIVYISLVFLPSGLINSEKRAVIASEPYKTVSVECQKTVDFVTEITSIGERRHATKIPKATKMLRK
jgi:hypothetical protein